MKYRYENKHIDTTKTKLQFINNKVLKIVTCKMEINYLRKWQLIYERRCGGYMPSISVSQFSLTRVIKYALTRCCQGFKSNFCHFSESSNKNLVSDCCVQVTTAPFTYSWSSSLIMVIVFFEVSYLHLNVLGREMVTFLILGHGLGFHSMCRHDTICQKKNMSIN